MKFTVGFRIASGFATLLLVFGLVGGIALWSMNSVSDNSEMLQSEYVPEVAMAGNVERWTWAAMFEMRGYGLTAQEEYLAKGEQYLNKVKELLGQTETLTEESLHLTSLKTSVAEIRNRIEGYESLIVQTRETEGWSCYKLVDSGVSHYPDYQPGGVDEQYSQELRFGI